MANDDPTTTQSGNTTDSQTTNFQFITPPLGGEVIDRRTEVANSQPITSVQPAQTTNDNNPQGLSVEARKQAILDYLKSLTDNSGGVNQVFQAPKRVQSINNVTSEDRSSHKAGIMNNYGSDKKVS